MLQECDIALPGSQIWNVRPLMIARAFVEGVDLRGTLIHPFVTYAVSGIGATVEAYMGLRPDATIGDSLAIRGKEVTASGVDVTAWLQHTSISARESGGVDEGSYLDSGESAPGPVV